MVANDKDTKDVKESAPRPSQDMNLVPEGDNPDLPIEAIEGDPEILIRRREFDRISHDLNISIERSDSPSMGSSEQLYTASQWKDITNRCAKASQEALRIARNLDDKPNEELPFVLPYIDLRSGDTTTVKLNTDDDDNVVKTTRVHRSRFISTPQNVIDTLKANCIFRGNSKRRQLDTMHTQLQTTGLLTLLLEQRQQPKILSLSDTGYTKEHLIVNKVRSRHDECNLSILSEAKRQETYITIPEDDIYIFNHDKARLMSLVQLMFHESYATYGEEAKKNGDPVQYYNDMMNHVFGNTMKDVNNAMEEILNFKVNRSVVFAIECVRWERLFENSKYVNGKELDEQQKLAFLMKHVYTDNRLGWHSTMSNAHLMKMTYDQCIEALYSATDAVPDKEQTVKTSYIHQPYRTHLKVTSTSGPGVVKNFCRNWQTGNCHRSKCRFLHEHDPHFNHASAPMPPTQSVLAIQPVSKNNRASQSQYDDRRSESKSYSDKRYDNKKAIQPSRSDNKPPERTVYRSGDVQTKSRAHMKRVEAERDDDFKSWGDTQHQGYRNQSLNSITFKKRKLYREEAAENEQKKEKEWEAMGRRSRSRELRAEARDRVRSQSKEQSMSRHDSVNDANSIHSIQEDISIHSNERYDDVVQDVIEDDVKSRVSNESRRAEPMNRRADTTRRPVVNVKTPAADYIHSIHGSYAQYNIKAITNDMLHFKYNDRRSHFNQYYVSAMMDIEKYYNTPEMAVYYETYIPTMANIGIAPHAWLYYDREHRFKLRLFNWNDVEDVCNEHVRKDIVNNTCVWYSCISFAAALAFGSLINCSYEGDERICYNMYFPPNFKYNHAREKGSFWSQQTCIMDYVWHANAIGAMKQECGQASNIILVDTLLCALVYDFMAFTSQILGYDRCYDYDRVRQIRFMLHLEVTGLPQDSFFVEQQLNVIFKYIIEESMPVYDALRHMKMNDFYIGKLNRECPPQNIKTNHLSVYSNKHSKLRTTISYLTSHRLNAISRSKNRIIIDTGASLCATSDKSILSNVTKCDDMVAYPAFGKRIKPKLRGEYGNLNLEALVIPSMPDTLISVSQLCYGGNSGKHNIAVFSTEGVRVFQFDTVREALKLMSDKGTEILRGYENDGIYVTDKDEYQPSSKQNLFLAQFKPMSLYDHLHLVTGHSGTRGMKWHRENSLNANYTEKDENRDRGICQGCVFGALGPTNTDQFRTHREIPIIPGQCFSLDAYTHTSVSARGRRYCDLYTDLATRRVYPVFTKDRSAQELCQQSRMLFLQHPDWTTNASTEQKRFIRLDSESNYRSEEFLAFTSSIGYNLERTPVRDKHANGIAERTVGLISAKTNVAMMSPTPRVPQSYWDFAMAYACDTQSYNFSSVIGTSPYMKITGQPVNIKYLQPFWSSCYVFIPREERNKIGSPRAYKAHFVGYANTTILFPNYVVVPVNEKGKYLKFKDSKNVIFDPTINFAVYTQNEEPYDREFENTDHYVPFLQRDNAPEMLQGPDAAPNISDKNDTYVPITPTRTIYEDEKSKTTKPQETEKTEENINEYHPPYEDSDGSPVYWYEYYVKNTEYPLVMCEIQHYKKIKIAHDDNVPQNYYKAMKLPEWREAIDKELTKFEKNLCLQLVPYNKQHLVPMMWIFNIKSDGTKKARLVGRGDLMIPYIDFDPYAVYCGNVTASSIKICITIAAKYKLVMKGGDLEGAYLVPRSNPKYPVYIKTPLGYVIPSGMCIQAIGNLYGFPPAGQNFSIDFDKCVTECGYVNTPWDLKFFYKWKNGKPILIIAHSDDFRWFGDKEELSEWTLLVDNFERNKYKVTDVTDNEFVGIKITVDENYNYYMNQTRMIDEILNEAHMKNEKDERTPYPYPYAAESLSKADNATEQNEAECKKFPYRRIIGQLMYGMVHTMVTIMYPLNVLSRYGNNPGPRHISFCKHLLRYVRTTKMDRLRFNSFNGPYDLKTMTGELQLHFQCDADLAGNLDNNHSQTSYLGYLGGSLICWCSTDQGSISTSTAESEVKAVNHTLKCEVIANRGMLTTMGWIQSPTIIEEDNKACIDASIVSHMTKRMRHLALTENFLKEKFADGTCILKKVDSKNNNADIGTKRLQATAFEYLTYPLVDQSLREAKRVKK